MADVKILEGKKVLIVDDEPDVLEALEEALGMCHIDTSTEYETAKDLLESKNYDIAVLGLNRKFIHGFGNF